MRVLNFNDFSKVYEAEAGGKISEDQESVLVQMCTLFFNTYAPMLALAKDYADTAKDFQSVIGAAIDAKPEEMKKITNNVAAGVTEEFKKEGVDKLWVDAAIKTADSLAILLSQFKDDKDAQDTAASLINKRFSNFLERLAASKSKIKKESIDLENSNQVFEGFFSSKKGSVNNLIKQGIVVDSLLKAEVENKDITSDVQKLQTELDGLLANLAKLSKGKKDDIDPKTVDTIADRLTEIPLELNKKKEANAKTNKSFGDASTLFVKALAAANKASIKEIEVKNKLAAEAAKAKEAGEKAGQSTIRLPKNITRAAVGSKEDETVGKVQQLILDKFKNNPDVADNELFRKFSGFGADKKFGGTTAGIIIALKAGFGLDDTSPDITQELLDELTKVKLTESENIIKNFDKFTIIMEDFDPAKFKAATLGANPALKPEIKRADVNKAVGNKEAGKEEVAANTAAKIEELVNKKFNEEKKKIVTDKLVELGAKELKDQKDGAIAWVGNMRFYPNGIFWRSTTGKTGKFPSDLSKGLDTIVTDELGNESTLGAEIKNRLGSLLPISKKLYMDINGINPRNKKLYSEILPALSRRELATLFRNYKSQTGNGLLKDLDNEWSNTSEIREFTRKFADLLKAEN